MDKVDALFLHSSVEHMGLNRAFGKTCSDSDMQIHDKRVAQLVVLLQQLDESAEGLEELPAPELSEIVSSAIRMCGFVDPIEERYAIAAVLEAIEVHDSMTESS